MRDGLSHGSLSAQLRSWRHLFLHGHACRPSLFITHRPPCFAPPGISRYAWRAAFRCRCHRHNSGSPSRGDDLAGRGFRLSGRWRRLKSLFARGAVKGGLHVGRNDRGEYDLWQRRFWEHTIRDETDLTRHVDYIHYNPAKHGLVSRVGDWPYSSFHRYVRLGWLPEDWGGVAMGSSGAFGERAD
jgi:REP element-mobilizing transposase RayT